MPLTGAQTLWHLPAYTEGNTSGLTPPWSTSWATTATGTRVSVMPRKINEDHPTPITSYNIATTAAAQTFAMIQFISEPLGVVTFGSMTTQGVMGVNNSAGSGVLVYTIYLYRPSDGSKAGISTPGNSNTLSTMAGTITTTFATRIFSVAAAQIGGVSAVGDRIVFEVGYQQTTTAVAGANLTTGNPANTADYALTSGLTTTLSPWMALGQDLWYGKSMNGTMTPRPYRPHPFQPGVAR